MKTLGADVVIDYNDSDAGAQIQRLANNKLEYAWDTISTEQSAKICAESLTMMPQLQPVYGAILPIKSPREDVRTVSTVMFTAFGKAFRLGSVHMPENMEDYIFAVKFMGLVEKLVAQVSVYCSCTTSVTLNELIHIQGSYKAAQLSSTKRRP